jgi:actin-related protein
MEEEISDNFNSIVIDIGSGTTKCGYSGKFFI